MEITQALTQPKSLARVKAQVLIATERGEGKVLSPPTRSAVGLMHPKGAGNEPRALNPAAQNGLTRTRAELPRQPTPRADKLRVLRTEATSAPPSGGQGSRAACSFAACLGSHGTSLDTRGREAGGWSPARAGSIPSARPRRRPPPPRLQRRELQGQGRSFGAVACAAAGR